MVMWYLQVVHIDLGIAFEQGLFLQTAERVPFRLTANIVDGMGAAGVEGTFRRCCETTLQVSTAGTSPYLFTLSHRGPGSGKDCCSGCAHSTIGAGSLQRPILSSVPGGVLWTLCAAHTAFGFTSWSVASCAGAA